ncbi:MAG: SDR family NAD(P)-dependent oxidoreductase [Hyphomicrobium sp.]|nr:SDR family NAD(P)-dependent oxidoreductase [Hyphomicrobium sp.]
MSRLKGKVAFITGGGGGIGRATAERFAEEGAKVVIADIDSAAGEASAASARERAANRGGDAHFIRCDITERSSVEAAMAETVARFGKLDILHNNAGGAQPADGPVTEAPDEEFWRAIKLDLYGTFLCSKIGILVDRRAHGPARPRLLHHGQGRHLSPHALDGRRIRRAQDPRERDRAVRDAHRPREENARRERQRDRADRGIAPPRPRPADPHRQPGRLSRLRRSGDHDRPGHSCR